MMYLLFWKTTLRPWIFGVPTFRSNVVVSFLKPKYVREDSFQHFENETCTLSEIFCNQTLSDADSYSIMTDNLSMPLRTHKNCKKCIHVAE
jgi:hypothetical protein